MFGEDGCKEANTGAAPSRCKIKAQEKRNEYADLRDHINEVKVEPTRVDI